MKSEVIISGASGFLGRAICQQLAARGWLVSALSTDPERAARQSKLALRWLKLDSKAAAEEIERIGKVINLAGAHPFERRWSERYKRTVFESRVGTTQRIVTALAASENGVLLNASGMGFYGHCGQEWVDDERQRGRRWFLSDMISAWEEAARQAELKGTRVALLRVGLALERDGGALPIIEQNFRRFVGGHVGDGAQFVPWIHNEDCAAVFVRALEDSAFSGGYVVAAPEPVSFAVLARAVGERLGGRSWFHPPAWLAKLMIGEASAILLESQRATPKRLLASGFSFRYPRLSDALAVIYARRQGQLTQSELV